MKAEAKILKIVWGQTHIESGLASILNATTPIFSVVLAHFLTKEERLTTNRVSGVAIGWIGVAVLIGIESLLGFGIEVIGQIAVLGATLSYAFAAIYGRRFKGISPLIVATGMLCGSTIMMTPLTLIVEQPWNLSPSSTSLMAIFGLAAISTSAINKICTGFSHPGCLMVSSLHSCMNMVVVSSIDIVCILVICWSVNCQRRAVTDSRWTDLSAYKLQRCTTDFTATCRRSSYRAPGMLFAELKCVFQSMTRSASRFRYISSAASMSSVAVCS